MTAGFLFILLPPPCFFVGRLRLFWDESHFPEEGEEPVSGVSNHLTAHHHYESTQGGGRRQDHGDGAESGPGDSRAGVFLC